MEAREMKVLLKHLRFSLKQRSSGNGDPEAIEIFVYDYFIKNRGIDLRDGKGTGLLVQRRINSRVAWLRQLLHPRRCTDPSQLLMSLPCGQSSHRHPKGKVILGESMRLHDKGFQILHPGIPCIELYVQSSHLRNGLRGAEATYLRVFIFEHVNLIFVQDHVSVQCTVKM